MPPRYFPMVAPKQVVTVHRFGPDADPGERALVLRPRDDLVREEADPAGGYRAASGPFAVYHRAVDETTEADGTVVLT